MKTDECTHRGRGMNLQWTPFFLLSTVWSISSGLYNIPDANSISRGHTSSSLPPTQWTWTRFLLACPPCYLCNISVENTSVQFTSGTRWISRYLRWTRVQLPPLHRQKSKASSSLVRLEGLILISFLFWD